MASALGPITGRFRGRIVFDIVASIGLGTVAAYTWWFTVSRPFLANAKAYDAKVKAQAIAETEAWLKERQA
ncbi:hypothetical protein BC831DRAFT_402552 [Entophlyctis helioformis]|nr:hypothetical protein BC831DRAFT_402552 [Entophlyctis helioformis]